MIGWTVSERVKAAVGRAEIKLRDRSLTPHSFRHTWNGRMRDVLPEFPLRYMMGHRSGSPTTELYDKEPPRARIQEFQQYRPAIDEAWDLTSTE